MSDFYEKVYQAVKLIPKGKVTTYGAIALFINSPKSSRAVGQALHNNPYYGVVPCHRVVNRNGYVAQNFVFGGANVQMQMLESENVHVVENKVDLKKYGWFFNK